MLFDGWDKNLNVFLVCFWSTLTKWVAIKQFTSWTSSATRPSGCSARHRQTRSWPYPTTWTILHRFWWPIGCVSVRFWTSCCLWRRYRRVRELQPLSIPRRRPSRPEHQHQRGWRICQPWGICCRFKEERGTHYVSARIKKPRNGTNLKMSPRCKMHARRARSS